MKRLTLGIILVVLALSLVAIGCSAIATDGADLSISLQKVEGPFQDYLKGPIVNKGQLRVDDVRLEVDFFDGNGDSTGFSYQHHRLGSLEPGQAVTVYVHSGLHGATSYEYSVHWSTQQGLFQLTGVNSL